MTPVKVIGSVVLGSAVLMGRKGRQLRLLAEQQPPLGLRVIVEFTGPDGMGGMSIAGVVGQVFNLKASDGHLKGFCVMLDNDEDCAADIPGFAQELGPVRAAVLGC